MVLVQNKIDLLHESQIDRLVYFDFTNFNYIQTRLVGYRPHIFVSCHWKSREFSIAFLHAISWGNSCEVSISNEILPFKLNWYYFVKIYLLTYLFSTICSSFLTTSFRTRSKEWLKSSSSSQTFRTQFTQILRNYVMQGLDKNYCDCIKSYQDVIILTT